MTSRKSWLIVHWISRVIVAGILLMGAVPKFTGGAEALVEKLPGGMAAVLVIGVAELAAVALMFIPKTSLVGSGLAAMLMLGAILSHIAGPVGMEGDFATMFIMAIIAFLAAAGATAVGVKRSCGCGLCRKIKAREQQV